MPANLNDSIPIPMEDENLHTIGRPFCSDISCPCHVDMELFRAYVFVPLENGEITHDEAFRVFWDEQLGEGNA